MHIHGGGWVLQSEKEYVRSVLRKTNYMLMRLSQDPGNTHMAHSGQLTVVSVGYRLAPVSLIAVRDGYPC